MSELNDISKLSPPAVWDKFADKFLQMSESIQFSVAQSEAELESVFRLRYATVIEKGWSQPEDFPDGLEHDIYDERAVQIIGRNSGGTLVATGRVVLPLPDKRLPTEDFFDLTIKPVQQVVDVGRGIVATTSQRHLVFLGLMSQSWVELRQRGFHEICGTMTKSMLRLYRLMDIPWIVMGDALSYYGEQRFPCKFDLEGTVAAYLSRHHDMLEIE